MINSWNKDREREGSCKKTTVQFSVYTQTFYVQDSYVQPNQNLKTWYLKKKLYKTNGRNNTQSGALGIVLHFS